MNMINPTETPGGKEQFISLLTEFLQIPSPSGREEKMAAAVRRHLDEIGYAYETDGAGNIAVRLEGREPQTPLCVVAAHMDEIGVVVTHVEEDGTLRVDRSGALAPFKLGERPLQILGDYENITGIISFGSGHTSTFDQGIAWDDVRVITGLSKAQLTQKGIRPGSTGVPITEGRGPLLMGDADDPMIAAWTFDDRAGVIMQLQLLQLLKEQNIQPLRPTIVAFTIHEEGGCHGAKILSHREKPEIFIAVDGCPWKQQSGIEVNDLPTTWSKDSAAHYDQRLIKVLFQAAQNAGTQCQTAVLTNARSDASAVYDSGAAPRVGILGHTRFNSHGFEVAKLNVFPNIVKTLLELFKMEW
jgi:putative aminopeptidase FrvX